jgi:hypothetical protein
LPTSTRLTHPGIERECERKEPELTPKERYKRLKEAAKKAGEGREGVGADVSENREEREKRAGVLRQRLLDCRHLARVEVVIENLNDNPGLRRAMHGLGLAMHAAALHNLDSVADEVLQRVI